MDALKSVLVAVDLSPCSKSALLQAARLARRGSAALRVLHVVDPLVVEDLEDVLPEGTDVRATVLSDARRELEAFCKDANLPAGAAFHAVVGTPLDEVLRAADDGKADLVVLGAWGASGEGRGVGTLAAKAARSAKVPVLLVDQRHTEAFASSMAGVDFSDHSARALDCALRVARLEGCPLHAVHVFEPPWDRLHYRAPTPQASPDYQRRYRDTLGRRLEAFVAERRKDYAQVPVTCALHESRSYGLGLADYARKNGIQLAVVGTLGRGNLRYALFGSTGERLLREAPCSVLAVPPR